MLKKNSFLNKGCELILISPHRNITFDYLRSFAIIVVVAYHSMVAYSSLAKINLTYPIDTISPITGKETWIGFDLFILFGDTFGMTLLFFISGFFVWKSLSKRGVSKFIENKTVRLGVPFIVGILILIPLAIYPAQLQVGKILGWEVNFIDFWIDFGKAGFWQPGHLWFLWLLLFFNLILVIFFIISPDLLNTLKLKTYKVFNNSLYLYGLLLLITMVLYIPMMLIFGPTQWVQIIGPLIFQPSRILLYLAFFIFGSIIGSYGLERTVFSSESTLTRYWWVWAGSSVLTFIIYLTFFPDENFGLLFGLAFTLTSVTTIFAFIAIFLRFAGNQHNAMDNLSKNSYGIYFIHYLFVVWFQYFLLEINLPLITKVLIVFSGSLLLSWISIIIFRYTKSIKFSTRKQKHIVSQTFEGLNE